MKFTSIIALAGVTQAARLMTHDASGTSGGPPSGGQQSGGPSGGPPSGGASNGGTSGGPPTGGASNGGTSGGPPTGGATSGGPSEGDLPCEVDDIACWEDFAAAHHPPCEPEDEQCWADHAPCEPDDDQCWDDLMNQDSEHDKVVEKARKHAKKGIKLLNDLLDHVDETGEKIHLNDVELIVREKITKQKVADFFMMGLREHANQWDDEGNIDEFLDHGELSDALEFLTNLSMEDRGEKMVDNHGPEILQALNHFHFVEPMTAADAADEVFSYLEEHFNIPGEEKVFKNKHLDVLEWGLGHIDDDEGNIYWEGIHDAICYVAEMSELEDDEFYALMGPNTPPTCHHDDDDDELAIDPATIVA